MTRATAQVNQLPCSTYRDQTGTGTDRLRLRS